LEEGRLLNSKEKRSRSFWSSSTWESCREQRTPSIHFQLSPRQPLAWRKASKPRTLWSQSIAPTILTSRLNRLNCMTQPTMTSLKWLASENSWPRIQM